jgi:hypothetical protein
LGQLAGQYPHLAEMITEQAMKPGYDYREAFEFESDPRRTREAARRLLAEPTVQGDFCEGALERGELLITQLPDK